MDRQARLSLMVTAATLGGNQALAKRGRSPIVADTGGGGLTTAEDEAAQATVIRALRDGDPGTNIIAEEAPDKHMTSQAYVIDPIDGSVGYARDGREWCCTIAHKDGDDIDAGVIYQPRTSTFVTAARGGRVSVGGWSAGRGGWHCDCGGWGPRVPWWCQMPQENNVVCAFLSPQSEHFIRQRRRRRHRSREHGRVAWRRRCAASLRD